MCNNNYRPQIMGIRNGERGCRYIEDPHQFRGGELGSCNNVDYLSYRLQTLITMAVANVPEYYGGYFYKFA